MISVASQKRCGKDRLQNRPTRKPRDYSYDPYTKPFELMILKPHQKKQFKFGAVGENDKELATSLSFFASHFSQDSQ